MPTSIELRPCRTTPVDHLSVDQVRARLAHIRAERSRLDAEEAVLVGHLNRLSSQSGSIVVPEIDVARFAGLRSRDAARVVQRSATLDCLPTFGDALRQGHIAAGHVDVVAEQLNKISPDDRARVLAHADSLLRSAAHLSVDQYAKHVRAEVGRLSADHGVAVFERQRRATYLKFWSDADGMVNLRGAFDPERGSVLMSRLERRVEAMFHSGDRETPVDVAPGIEPNDHRRALALVAAVEATSSDVETSPGAAVTTNLAPAASIGARSEIIVHVDLTTLTGGLTAKRIATTQHGVDLPIETIRRLACEAEIVPIVMNGESVPLDVGRSKRLATVHQRRALGAMYDSCAIDGCEVAFKHCEPHHIDYWENGGSTDLGNLVPLCSRHHHAAHEGGWRLRLDPRTRHLSVDRPPPGR